MSRYTVQLARIEHRIYEIEVKAESVEAAKLAAMAEWEDSDLLFKDLGCVHAEESIHEVKKVQS